MKTKHTIKNPAVPALVRAGVRLRDARLSLGLSKAEVARRADLTAASVGRAEAGANLVALNIGRVAGAVGVTFEDLFKP